MKKLALSALALVPVAAFSIATNGFCLDLSSIPWNKANLQTLQSANADDVLVLLKSDKVDHDCFAGGVSFEGVLDDMSTYHTTNFRWENLNGGDQYQL